MYTVAEHRLGCTSASGVSVCVTPPAAALSNRGSRSVYRNRSCEVKEGRYTEEVKVTSAAGSEAFPLTIEAEPGATFDGTEAVTGWQRSETLPGGAAGCVLWDVNRAANSGMRLLLVGIQVY